MKNNMSKQITGAVVLVSSILLGVMIFVSRFPFQYGMERVKLEGIGAACTFLLGIIWILSSYFLIRNMWNKKQFKSLEELCVIGILLVTGVIFFVLGTFRGSLVISGLNSEKRVFEGSNYTFDITYAKHKKYSLILNDSLKNRSVKVRIDSSTYEGLEDKPEIKVTYYPYINIVEKIEYK